MPSTIAELDADLDTLADPFDFTEAGLGQTLRTIAAEEIDANMSQQADPDGGPWAALSPRYEEWKQVYAPGAPMAVLDHIMWTPMQLMGRAGITSSRMYHHYGDGDAVALEHAYKFGEGDPLTSQPPRPFWGFTSQAFARMDAECDARFVAKTA